MQSQKETPLYEPPVLTLKAIAEKMTAMDKEVIRLLVWLKMIVIQEKKYLLFDVG